MRMASSKEFKEKKERYKVSKEDCERIYKELVLPRALRQMAKITDSPSEPTAIYIGGQAGAGKSCATRNIQDDIGHVFTIDIDALRERHPDYASLVKEDPLLMPALTNQFAKDMANRLTKYCEKNHVSFMREGTWKDSIDTLDRMRQSKEAGMKIEAVVVAVPPSLSSMGTVYRYCKAKEQGDPPRWADWEYQQQPLDNIGDTVRDVANSGVVDEMKVFSRDECLATMSSPSDMRLRAHGAWHDGFNRHLSEKEQGIINDTVEKAEQVLDPTNPAETNLISQFDEMCEDISIGGKYSTGDAIPAVEARAVAARRERLRKQGQGKDNRVGETCDVTGYVKSNGVMVRSHTRRIGSPGPRSGREKA